MLIATEANGVCRFDYEDVQWAIFEHYDERILTEGQVWDLRRRILQDDNAVLFLAGELGAGVDSVELPFVDPRFLIEYVVLKRGTHFVRFHDKQENLTIHLICSVDDLILKCEDMLNA